MIPAGRLCENATERGDLLPRRSLPEFYLADRVPSEGLAQEMHRLVIGIDQIQLEVEAVYDPVRKSEFYRFLALEHGVEVHVRRAESPFDGRVPNRKEADLQDKSREGLDYLSELLELVR